MKKIKTLLERKHRALCKANRVITFAQDRVVYIVYAVQALRNDCQAQDEDILLQTTTRHLENSLVITGATQAVLHCSWTNIKIPGK